LPSSAAQHGLGVPFSQRLASSRQLMPAVNVG
jgi:hypothetical protein